MPKNKTPEQPEQPVEKATTKKEPMVRVFAEEGFVDGNLRQFFEKYGYDVEWPRNEIRVIPIWLYVRCVNSGGVFTNADD